MFNALITHKKIRLLTILSTAACIAFGGASVAQRLGGDIPAASHAELGFAKTLDQALASGKIGDVALVDPVFMRSFYDQQTIGSYWVGFFGVHKNVRVVLKKFESAWTHGLNPDLYHLDEIKSLMDSDHPEERARLELLLTDGYLRYVRDLSGMRPQAKAIGLTAEHWVQPVSSGVALSWLDLPKLGPQLDALEPKGKVYNTFRKELMRLVKKQSGSSQAMAAPIVLGRILRPGQSHEAVPLLRTRMGLPQPERAGALYDDALAAAVIEFQKSSNLTADGAIGPQTLNQLNAGSAGQIRQIMVNMERMRWMPESLGPKYVVVNIPSAMLWAVKDGRTAVEMPVIVGRPERPTPIFRTEITGMRFNPNWTIPPTIKTEDILPQIQADINFLYDRNIELSIRRDGKRLTIDPASIDWTTISEADLRQIDMVQIPGDNNPLGRYRVLMPNAYNIYLHDTNHPEMFDIPERAFSSGCMRMKNPEEMARFVLDGQEGWTSEKIERVVASGRRIDVPIDLLIPVHVVYYSAWLDKDGDIVFGPDIYGEDKRLYQTLLKMKALPFAAIPPEASPVKVAQGAQSVSGVDARP